MDYKFIKILQSEEHVEILFTLLSQRKFNISHIEMPSKAEHKEFVFSKPYKFWFLVKCEKSYIGTFYIQDNNSISINIKEKFYVDGIPKILSFIKSNFIPNKPIKSLIPKYFYINTPSGDIKLHKVLSNIGYKHNQISYIINWNP